MLKYSSRSSRENESFAYRRSLSELGKYKQGFNESEMPSRRVTKIGTAIPSKTRNSPKNTVNPQSLSIGTQGLFSHCNVHTTASCLLTQNSKRNRSEQLNGCKPSTPYKIILFCIKINQLRSSCHRLLKK